MTGTETFTGVRDQIRDSPGAPRFTNPKLLRYLLNGLDFLWDTHPEAFAGDSIPVDRPARILMADIGEELPITSSFDLALIHYIASKAMSEDAEEAANREVSQFQFAQEQIQSGNAR